MTAKRNARNRRTPRTSAYRRLGELPALFKALPRMEPKDVRSLAHDVAEAKKRLNRRTTRAPAPAFPANLMPPRTDGRPEARALLANIKKKLPQLEELLDSRASHAFEDAVYRFYHESFKVYSLQGSTQDIVAALRSLAPDRPLNAMFAAIVAEGTGKKWELEHNKRWPAETRPILEAYFHSLYFLKMAVRYGRELKQPPAILPSGWAALLYLYNLR